ncbi:4Fe-4S dicluster domain-containing protein [Magnetospirillum sp. UT-4]|uniref:4Fe-4S dicluster domain-containing protein n=1 Tax=Magnetospirillum sp. UT-4 TaxID=2681467 RepID=UPI001380B796|nr:4Fe-4S dicluster domain-containing protein [Magnetospirillum sp. UT-4]CAA7620495.1 Perchlorate reductase subunit beta [Magnetospirillum sp. UT-4]
MTSSTRHRQMAFVIDLNKCIGCQGCTIACKRLWTTAPGLEAAYWMNVETVPGRGYPRDWAGRGGGFDKGRPKPGREPTPEEYGIPFEFDYSARLFSGKRDRGRPRAAADWAPNWEEDQGAGAYPNTYFFYLPRMCNHCDRPACAEACEAGAIRKRPEDGLVLLDPDRCDGSRACVAACPYAKTFFDAAKAKAHKCHGCFPRLEAGLAPACVAQCTGRAMHVGFLDDGAASVHKLVRQWGVALPLMDGFGTGPNVFYIPPFIGPAVEGPDGTAGAAARIPDNYLASLFGPDVRTALRVLRAERRKRGRGEPSELMDLLIGRDARALLGHLQPHPSR